MGYTRKNLRDALDNKFNDASNLNWTANQKNDAINEAIDALWPECKSAKVDETITLKASTLYTARTISFTAATKTIADAAVAPGLAIFETGDTIIVSGSTSNDGIYTVITGGVAGAIVVGESLTTEAAAAEITIRTNIFIYMPTGQPTEMGYSQAFLEQGSDEPYILLRRVAQWREAVGGVLKWKIDVPEDIVSANVGKKIRLHYHGPFDHYAVAYYRASTIAFAATTPGTITDSANGLAGFKTGDIIIVSGSTINDGTYTVSTGGVPGTIRTTQPTLLEALGDDVTIDDGNLQDVPWLPVLHYCCMALCIIMLQKAGSSDISVWANQIPTWEARWMKAKRDNLVLSMPRHVGLRRR